MPSTQSASLYVNAAVSLEGSSTPAASFGVPALIFEHDVEDDRVAGPFSTAQDLTDFGISAGSAAHDWAGAMIAQQPHPQQFYIVRRDAGDDADDGDAFVAALAENPSAFYAIMSASRESADIQALSSAVSSADFPKFHIAQSSEASLLLGVGPTYNALFEGTVADGTYILTFTGFGLGSPVTVTTTRTAGSPATLSLVADAFRTALTTAAGGSLSGVVVTSSIGGVSPNVSFRIADGLAAGTVVASGTAVASTADLTVSLLDYDIGSWLFQQQSQRTALVYHDDDAEFLDGAWAALGLSFDLDVRKGIWAYLQPSGIAASQLSNTQVAALRNVNANYFSPAVMSSGVATQAFAAQGWVPYGTAGAGMRIDTRITLDWLQARMQEAGMSVLLRAASSGGVPFTDAGIGLFGAAFQGVLDVGVAARHLLGGFVVPDGSERAGTVTPAIFAPKLRSLTSTQRASRQLSLTGLAYTAEAIERVNIALEVRR